MPNIGIVVGEKAVLVIDCGLGPECGQHTLEAVEKVAPGRRLFLTQTHAHPEHVFGAAYTTNKEIEPGSDQLTKSIPAG